MSKRRGKMTDEELAALCRSEIDDSIGYAESSITLKRAKALDYYQGELPDVRAEEGRSKVTSHDLSDAIGWIMPGLMRVFTATDRVVEYHPETPADVEFAQQATDYVNYVVMRECQGYRVLQHALLEGLLFGNGIIKHWWDTEKSYETSDYSGLSDEAYTMLVEDDDVEVLQHTAETITEMVPGPDGQPVEAPVTLHAVKIRRLKATGRPRIECLPPEEFLIDKRAKSIEDARFCGHRTKRYRADLIAEGYPRDRVEAIGSGDDLDDADEKLARFKANTAGDASKDSDDPMMEEVEVFECYVRCDYDGDGHAEWRKVVLAGSGSGKSVLSNEEWDDDVPFSDIVPMPMPHRWEGRSLYDELEDVQRIKTVLMRQTLDNLYWVNHPQRAAAYGQVDNPDELMNPTFGGVVWEKSPGAVRDLPVPFVAANSFQMIEFLDAVIEKRTGVSRQSQALDPDALQNQTAAGMMAAQSAAYAKIEMYARNIAELGLKRMFRCILKILVRHQDRPKMIRLREQWVEMDPRGWNANMDASISVGLGTGSRDRDMMMLQQIAQIQERVIEKLGPTNPLANIKQLSNTLTRLVESSGLRSPEQYITEVTDEQLEQMAQAEGQKKDPEVQKAEAKAQADQIAMQAQIQLKREVAAFDAQMAQQKLAADLEATRERNALEIQLQREKAAADMELRREEAMLNGQLRRDEMLLEAQLTAEANRMRAANDARQADTNIMDRAQ